MTLQRLLHPHTAEDFLSHIWEKKHLHVSRHDNPALQSFFDELMSLDDIDRLLTTTFAAEPRRWDSVRLGRDGVMIPPDQYLSRRDGILADIDVERVLTLHRSGASIILNSVQATLEPVAELCSAISGFMGVRVHANVYLTPHEAQGFPLHFDPHDVFLLQIAGRKHWKLYPSSVPLATAEPQEASDLEPRGAATRIVLDSGELLYIPRGILHEGLTADDMSAHLTIGLNPYTWSQLMHDLVAELEREDVDFRRSVPAHVAAEELDGQFGEALSKLTGRLVDESRASRIAKARADESRGHSHPPLRGLLRQIHELDRIELDTVVRVSRHGRPEIRRDGAEIKVSFGGGVLTLPAFTEPHVATLCSGNPVRGADLPDTLDDPSKLVLLRRLVREGLLVPATDG